MTNYWYTVLKIDENISVDVLETSLAITYLPHYLIQAGINIVTTMGDNSRNAQIQEFAAHLRRAWLPLAPIFSVHDNPLKTNHTFELYQRQMYRESMNELDFFQFLSILNKHKNLKLSFKLILSN